MPSAQDIDEFKRQSNTSRQTPLPPFPKIPEQIKARHPENAEAWNQYDAEVQAFFDAQQTSQ